MAALGEHVHGDKKIAYNGNMNQDHKIKYLQMIQDVVKRMADTSAAMKRYTLVSFAGATALARALEEPGAMLLAMVLVFIFWAMDAQYLRQEKWYRDMYDAARELDPDKVDFNLTPSADLRNKTGIGYGFDSWSTRWLYVPLLIISFVLWSLFV